MTTPNEAPASADAATSFASFLPSLFTDEQRNALEDDDAHDTDSRCHVYHNAPDCPDHHTQLLDALQVDDIWARLDHTHTSAGTHTLRKWLEHPLTCADDIRTRQSIRHTVARGETHATTQTLATMEDGWTSLCWCWHDGKSKTELVESLLFTGLLTPLNNIPLVQNVYHHMRVCGTPLVHCLAPLVPVLISYVMLRWMGAGMTFSECWNMSAGVMKNTLWFDDGGGNKLSQMFGGGEGSGGGAQSLVASLSSAVPMVLKSLKWVWWLVFVANIVLMVYQCYRHYKLLSHVYARTHRAARWLVHARTLANHTDTTDALDTLQHWVDTSAPSYSLFTNAYDFLHAYALLRSTDVRNLCAQLVRKVGVVDALLSVDKLLHTDTFTEPDIVVDRHTTPALTLTHAFHPKLGDDQTTHDLTLNKHVVLTGSNASGKSTVLKTLLLNVLLAQSWGVVCAKAMRWTPFALVRGYLHTVDDCGTESLFQAQIRRIEEFIEGARTHQQSGGAPSLLVVDEILNSTNPIEAMLLSYQYARTVGAELSDTSRMVMTTHYPVLTTLAKHHPDTFSNWAMRAGYNVCVGKACRASSAIGTVKQMTRVLGAREHAKLEKAYARMYKRLVKMRFKELDGDETFDEKVKDDAPTEVLVAEPVVESAKPLAPAVERVTAPSAA